MDRFNSGKEGRVPKQSTQTINRKEKYKLKNKIINYIRAGYPGLYLVSPEEQRVEAEIKQIATELEYRLFFCSCVEGLVDVGKGTNNSANDPLEALVAIKDIQVSWR
jgi:hypothetical protein